MKFFILIITLLSSHPLWANQNLDRICQSIIKDKVIKANFTQHKTIQGLPKPLLSQGELILWNGHGILWSTKSPFPSQILLSKKGIFKIDGDKKTPLMKGQHQDQFVMNILEKVLSGSFSDINEFDVKVISWQPEGSWKIQLLPTGAMTKFLQAITLEGAKVITHLSIRRANGDQDEIFLDHHHSIPEIPLEFRKAFND